MDDYSKRENHAKELIVDRFKNVVNPFTAASKDELTLRSIELLQGSFDFGLTYPDETANEAFDFGAALNWYVDLSLFDAHTLQYIIPRLMVSLIDGYPGETIMLVNFLSLTPVRQVRAARALAYSETKRGMWSEFSRPQVEAILVWLQLAATWPEVEFHLSIVNSVIDDWIEYLKQLPI